MARLEDLTPGAVISGLRPNENVVVIAAKFFGSNAVDLTYRDTKGNTHSELIYRDAENRLELVDAGHPWSFDADGDLLRLAAESYRINLAHLFDPHLAVHTSLVEPLPHQITAVYEVMLPRQPLRFLLADDPGAGKTIMAGLLMKELIARGDLSRCLVVCPGSLVEQWQDELYQKFQLDFEIITNDRIESARSGNVFNDVHLAVVRLDKMARDESLHPKLQQSEWDLIVCDEAHKMSASFFSGEIKETKRYKLAKLLSPLARHFLLMTATPHNGKEEDFQLFLALLDGDRFEGKFRDGVHTTDTSDLMRRMVKEQLLKFDGTPLFPERKAYTVTYELSDLEAKLYHAVTQYVREEFNRAEKLQTGRKGTVGFALMVLQRRLASSPEAIYQSIRRRKERLERRLREEELLNRGANAGSVELQSSYEIPEVDEEEFDDAPVDERENLEEQVLDEATAARTINEFRAEIETLKLLEELAREVKHAGTDRKWEEMSKLLHDHGEMFDAHGHRRKLIIFTEHRDTLNYLANKIRAMLGNEEAIVTISGGMGREERRNAQESFTQDKNVLVLVATDAAGEGINLQRAHLMVNYDLPWNPNRIEQRFGRIHRIGQTEVCHLWNLVAAETREGDVYQLLLRKLEVEKEALGGSVFDVLGKAIDGKELRRLLMEAILYGDDPEVKARLDRVVEDALDREHLQELIEEHQLIHETLDASRVQKIREDMERIEARRLQPHYIEAFFKQAFEHLGGTYRERETKRYEIKNVPATIRSRDRQIGFGAAVLRRYERACFEKQLISMPGLPQATFLCPGHPLLTAVIDLILERYRNLLKQGAVLIDESDPTEDVRALLFLEHSVKDARPGKDGGNHLVSRKMQFVEIYANGDVIAGGQAPYLDYRSPTAEEFALVKPILDESWLNCDLENQAIAYAIEELVPAHLDDVNTRKKFIIDKTIAAVKDRLTKEINYWDHRAEELKAQEQAGRPNARINSKKARDRADELQARLQKRIHDLELERQISALPPYVTGGALIVPMGMLDRLQGGRGEHPDTFARETKRVEMLAMLAVMQAETELGFEPTDVSMHKLGYDIESRVPGAGKLRFIEVKGRIEGANSVVISKNEILTGFNKPEDFILALVQVPADENFGDRDAWDIKEGSDEYGPIDRCMVRYVRRPFQREPDFGVTSVIYNLNELLERSQAPN